jgi:hypothetical protein
MKCEIMFFETTVNFGSESIMNITGVKVGHIHLLPKASQSLQVLASLSIK